MLTIEEQQRIQILELEHKNTELTKALAMVTPTLCGQNPILPAERVGCGRTILNETDCYRCMDCGTPFHRECLKAHCQSAWEATRRVIEAWERLGKCEDEFGCNSPYCSEYADALDQKIIELRAALEPKGA